MKMMLTFFCAANLLAFCIIPSSVLADVGEVNRPEAVIKEFEAVVTVTEDDAMKPEEVSSESSTFDRMEYMRDLRNAVGGRGAMDPEKVYTAQAMLPVGEMLVLATASGCSLLNDPEEVAAGKIEPLEFSFRVADLEDCTKVTESIVGGLQAEIAAEWGNLSGTSVEGGVTSSTSLQDIGMRRGNRASERSSTADDNFGIGVQDMANAFLAANLEVKLLPTTAEGVVVMHFDITGNTSAQEIVEMMKNIDTEKLREVSEAIKAASDKVTNATPEELHKMEQQLKSIIERNSETLRQEIEDGKGMLEELSSDGIAEIECSALALGDCPAVSKCSVVNFNGKETCAVSPKTVFLLMETGCGLQSKSGLMSIVRDLVSMGIMTEATHQTLRQSFDLAQICNAIVHTYMSADIAETESHETKRSFDL